MTTKTLYRTYYKHNSYIRMPWGKYQGRYLREIPDDYLKWAIMTWSDAGMAEMMAIELARREPKFKK
jgi:uncharacterized protein (DUF3820 family)